MKRRATRSFLCIWVIAAILLSLVPILNTRAVEKDYMKLTIPKGWVKMETAAVPTYGNTNFGTVIVTRDTMPADVKTSDAYMTFVKKAYQKSFKNVKFKSLQKAKIAGKQARKLVFSCKVSSIDMTYHVVYVFEGTKVHTLTCGSLSTNYKANSKDFQKIISSIKL